MKQNPPLDRQAKRAPDTTAWIRRPRRIAATLIVIAALRVVPTYRVFSATADEATHVGAGLELIQFHRYDLHRENPPIPRLVLALAPELAGMRIQPGGTYSDRLHRVFYGTGNYERNLFVSRLGNLVFLVIASCALFLWARLELGSAAALIALFLFTFQPVILGHGALATTDMAATAGMAVSLLAFARWLQERTFVRAAVFAAAYAFAVCCKFSNIAFVPLACGAILLVRAIRERTRFRDLAASAARLIGAAAAVTPVAVWAVYGFTVGRVGDMAMPLPAPAFVWGVARVIAVDRAGFGSYFFGHVSTTGWPMYFPVTIALKTTIAFLVLVVAAAIVAWRAPDWRGAIAESAAAVALILLFVSRSNMDLGIRYVLPVFIPLAMVAAASAMAISQSSRRWALAVAAILAIHAGVSIAAHPDYFPYFNAFAGRDPSRILVDSNLDWGQDVLRLRRALRESHVERVGLSLMGGADYDALGFPANDPLDGTKPSGGWVAVSDHVYRMDQASMGAWYWLHSYKYRRIGRSIRLFDIPER